MNKFQELYHYVTEAKLPYGMSIFEPGAEHRPDIVQRDPQTGKIIAKEWRKNGRLHADGDNPAAIYYDWSWDEIPDTTKEVDGDTLAMKRIDSIEEMTVVWCQNGVIDRPNGKYAKFFFRKHWDGNYYHFLYYRGGKMYKRISKEAYNSSAGDYIRVLVYNSKGELHNLNGPALYYINKATGKIEEPMYYLDNKYMSKEQFERITGEVDEVNIEDINDMGDLF